MNLYELGRWKDQIINTLIQDENIVDILLPEKSDELEIEEQLLGNGSKEYPGCVFQHEYIPEIQEQARSFICVETVAPKVTNTTTEVAYIYIWAFSHKSLLDTYQRKGVKGTRVDILASDIDKIMNYNGKWENSIGKTILLSANIYKPAIDYYGRVLVYECATFNRSN